MKVLNLYAGIGGNRKMWQDVEVTAVENNLQVADVYHAFFPDDNLIIQDAHQYLLNHYKEEWGFIWSSPPCQTHSSFRQNICVRYNSTPAAYPDLSLYEEILFLKYNSICPFVVENVNPYYPPLIPAKQLQRHLFWSNFNIPPLTIEKDILRHAQIPDLERKYDFDLSNFQLSDKRQVLRNCVHPELGLHIFKASLSKPLTLNDFDL